MTLYAPRYDQLIQGISRQHPSRRAIGQHTEQINCISDIVQGLRRRPSFKLMDYGILAAGDTLKDSSDYVCHMYNRGDGQEAYIMIVNSAGGIQVYNAYTGDYMQTIGNIYASYLTQGTGRMRDKLGFFTIADTTYVWNKQAVVAEKTELTPTIYTGFLLWCKRSSYGKTYTVRGLGTTAAKVENPSTVTLPISEEESYTDKTLLLSTSDLAFDLSTELSATFIAEDASASAVAVNGMVYINAYGLTQSEIGGFRMDDSGNFEDVVLIKDHVNSIEELPPHAPDGYIIKIEGLGNTDIDDFYVRWDADDQAHLNENGKWVECAAPGIPVGIDNSTMPLRVIRTWSGGDPVFTVNPGNWAEREAGDEDTNPMPSFVGSTIQDIFTYQNRLWFLSEENAVASRSFDYNYLFAESVAQAADTDPIDSSSSDNQITNLKYGVPFNSDMFIQSHNAQFLHDGLQTVKPLTFALTVDTKYPTNPAVRPIVLGNSLMFPTVGNKKVSLWEFRKDQYGNPDANDMSNHVGNYMLNESRLFPIGSTFEEVEVVESIAAHPAKGMFFMASGGDIIVVQVYYANQQRVQLAFHKWVLGKFEEADSWHADYDGYTERPRVSDVFVVDNKLIALARFDSKYTDDQYYPRFLELDLDLLDSTYDDPEVFMDYSLDSGSVNTAGPHEYDGVFYDCYADLPFFKYPGDDPETTYGNNKKEQYFNMLVTSGSDDTDACPNGYVIDDWVHVRASEASPLEYDRIYFNCPSAWLAADFTLTLGCDFESSVELSQPYVRDSTGRAYTEDSIIDDIVIDMEDTVEFDVEIDNKAGDGYTHTFNGNLVNNFGSLLGTINHTSRPESVAICNSRELCTVTIKSNGYYGFRLAGCTWHINMHSNGRRV